MTYPIPKSISVGQICGEDFRCQEYVTREVDNPKRPNGWVHLFEAYNYLKRVQFGKAVTGEVATNVFTRLQQMFFSGSGFREWNNSFTPVEIKIKSSVDGDTFKLSHFILDGKYIPFKTSIRLDGIDALESNTSGKLDNLTKYTGLYLSRKYGQGEIPSQMVEDRIVYGGKIAGAVTEGFKLWAKHISLAPSYTRAAEDPNMCGTIDFVDKYGRILGRVKSGRPNEPEDNLAGFIQNVLPEIMSTRGREYHNEFRQRGEKYDHILNDWRTGQPELLKILGPDTLPDPAVMFSRANCLRLAEGWKLFCRAHPEARNDIQTMMAFIGVAWPYPKYRSNMTPVDVAAEAAALGGVHGLNGDPIYAFMRANADRSDPHASPVYIMFEQELSGGRSLNPPDCREDKGQTSPQFSHNRVFIQ